MNDPLPETTDAEKQKALRLYAQLEADRLEREAEVLWEQYLRLEEQTKPVLERLEEQKRAAVKARDEACRAWSDAEGRAKQLRKLFAPDKPTA